MPRIEIPNMHSLGDVETYLEEVAGAAAGPVFNVKGYRAKGDGVANDTEAIQRAIDDCAAAGGGIVFLPAGTYKITASLVISSSSVYLLGVGHESRVFGGTQTAPASRLLWGGTSGTGPMIDFGAALSATEVILGGGVSNLTLDGFTLATVGLRVRASMGSTFRDLYVRECQQDGILTYSEDSMAPLGGNNNVYSCSFENLWVYNYTYPAANCIRLSGSMTGAAGGTTFCSFKHVHLLHRDGAGIVFENCDDCSVFHGGASRSSGTGYALDFKGAGFNGGARHNSVFQFQGTGGIISRAGTAGVNSMARNNVVFAYSEEDDPPTPVIEAGSTLLYITGSGLADGLSSSLRKSGDIVDDFAAGGATSSNIGELGWQVIVGTGGTTSRTQVAGRFGVRRIASGTTAGNLCQLNLSDFGGSATGGVHADDWFDLMFALAQIDNDTDTMVRVGMVNDGADPPVNGIYFEKLYADTNWFAVCRAAGVQTRTDMGLACNTSYRRLRIRRISATQISFSIDANPTYPTQIVIATNVPAAMGLAPSVQVKTQAAATKRVDVDYMRLRVAGLAR